MCLVTDQLCFRYNVVGRSVYCKAIKLSLFLAQQAYMREFEHFPSLYLLYTMLSAYSLYIAIVVSISSMAIDFQSCHLFSQVC